ESMETILFAVFLGKALFGVPVAATGETPASKRPDLSYTLRANPQDLSVVVAKTLSAPLFYNASPSKPVERMEVIWFDGQDIRQTPFRMVEQASAPRFGGGVCT